MAGPQGWRHFDFANLLARQSRSLATHGRTHDRLRTGERRPDARSGASMKKKLAEADAKREAGVGNFRRARREIKYGKFASNEEQLRLIDLVEKIQDWHASKTKAEHEYAGQEILVRLAAAS